MKKQSIHYEVSFRGTTKECLEFEKILNYMRVSIEQMQEWDEINDEDNVPSGIVHWSKFKYLKHSEILFKEGDRPKININPRA